MSLKNALAVCLISLFSATIVVLIARVLDSQAASQLEPQLTEIAKELRALRKQGGVSASPANATPDEDVDDGLIVYYLHSSYRCPTCRTVEAQTKKTVENDFARQVERGEIVFKAVNYEKPAGEQLAQQFKVTSAVVVLAAMKGGKIDVDRSKRLDKVLPLAANDVAALAAYLHSEIKAMLPAEAKSTDPAAKADSPAIPIPNADKTPGDAPPEIPIPSK
jgi:hypothetical protein